MAVLSALRHCARPLFPFWLSRALLRAAVARPRALAVVKPGLQCLGLAPKELIPAGMHGCIAGPPGQSGRHERMVLTSPWRPDLFVDIGANYGTHSLLFLVNGVRTISIEPNPACYDYFEDCTRRNGVTPDIRGFVVGDSHDPAELVFPDDATQFGSADPGIQERLRTTSTSPLRRLTAPQTTVDDLLASETSGRLLMKIDTEGFETRVLRGARTVLDSRRPVIIFESWPSSAARSELFAAFAERGYDISTVPWTGGSYRPLTGAEFERAISMNFIAFPARPASDYRAL